jgi:lipoprotein-anchoring transpeptidase ErfK/SrfK
MLAGFAILVAVLLAALLARSCSEDTVASSPQTTSTTTTSTTSTTTTTVLPLDPGETRVATAQVPLVVASMDAPSTRSAAIEKVSTDARARFASYSPERPDAKPIPSLTSPVDGRRRTETGWEFSSPTPFGNPLTFVVTEDQGEWLKVLLPVRPNGSEAWIKASDVTVATHRFHVDVNRSTRTLVATDNGAEIARTLVVVGKDSTKTPLGHFYVTDYEEKHSGSAYGPWVLPLSAFSQDLDWFGGGVPLIAMHGTNNPGLIGSAASNGCIRMPDAVITLLRERLPLGTPVDIHD